MKKTGWLLLTLFPFLAAVSVCAQDSKTDLTFSRTGNLFYYAVNWTPGSSTETYQAHDLLRFLQGSSLQPIVSENAVVVGTNIPLVESSSRELVFGLPSGATPGFTVGDVIVGDPENPFFARVLDVTTETGSVRVQTGTATLAEIVEQGYLRTALVFVPGATKGLSLPLVKGITGTVEVPSLVWNATQTFEESGVTATLVGEASIQARIELEAELRQGIKFFRAEAIGKLGINLSIDIDSKNEYDKGPLEGEVARWNQVFLQKFGEVPIWEQVTIRLVAGIDLDTEASTYIEKSAWAHTQFNLGGKYDRDLSVGNRWKPINSTCHDSGFSQPIYSVDGNLLGRAYVRPEIQIKFYSFTGLYFDIRPYVEFQGNATLVPQPNCEWWLRTGVDAELIFEINILDGDLARWTKSLGLWSKLLTNGACSPPSHSEMVYVPAGTFTMGRRDDGDDGDDEAHGGGELPRHQVNFPAYEIGKFEVTNAEYAKVLNWANDKGYLRNSNNEPYTKGDVYANGKKIIVISDNNCQIHYGQGMFFPKNQEGYSMENHPVVDVTWFGAVAFCNWLSVKERRPSCYNLSTWELTNPSAGGYRLPSEAEWENAAAWDGAKHWIYGFQSDTLTGKDRCNYKDGSSSVNPLGLSSLCPYTSPVGWFNGTNISPNGNVQTIDSQSPVGCYDMSGNVWEWCEDWWHSTYTGAPTDGSAWLDQESDKRFRLLRGGGFNFNALECRTARRNIMYPDDGHANIGFRLVKTP